MQKGSLCLSESCSRSGGRRKGDLIHSPKAEGGLRVWRCLGSREVARSCFAATRWACCCERFAVLAVARWAQKSRSPAASALRYRDYVPLLVLVLGCLEVVEGEPGEALKACGGSERASHARRGRCWQRQWYGGRCMLEELLL